MTALHLDTLIERLNEYVKQWEDFDHGTWPECRAMREAAAALVQLRDENAELVRHQRQGWQRVYAEPSIKVFMDHAERAEAKCDALQQKVRRMRRALRQLNKAHRVLWRVILYRNEFHDFAVKQGAFIEFRNATEKRP